MAFLSAPVNVYSVRPSASTSTDPCAAVIAAFTTGFAARAGAGATVVLGVCDGWAPGDTVAFDDEPHAASATTAARPVTTTANFLGFVFM